MQIPLFPQPSDRAFDSDIYLSEQSAAIIKRMDEMGGKLYLEFGGKLLFDQHAARVLPGFDPNIKMRLLRQLKDRVDIILCIHAGDIERKKIRADFGITYDADAFKLIDDLRDWGLDICAVVITRFSGQAGAVLFQKRLERRGIRVYTHGVIEGYPADVDLIVSEAGYGSNDYIETTRPLVVVTAPGPCSGKLATCLSQLFHEAHRGTPVGYAKFETFPIWSLPLRHPVNAAYEAATADLRDVNLIDPFHLQAYGKAAVNYNRDVEAFPLLQRIIERITGAVSPYKSPTDMGVNRAGFAIINDELACEAGKQEILRRWHRYACEAVMGFCDSATLNKVGTLMEEFGLKPEDRDVVMPARRAAEKEEAEESVADDAPTVFCGAALRMPSGEIVTGHNSALLHASSAVVLNAIKSLAGIPKQLHLLSPNIVESIAGLKKDILERKTISLDLEETLIALSICSTNNHMAGLAMEQLKVLRGCEVHLTHLPAPGDEKGLRQLGVNLTCDPKFATSRLFVS